MTEQEIKDIVEENRKLKYSLDLIEKKRKQKIKSKWNFRSWLAGKAVNVFTGKNLKQSLVQLYNELPHSVTKDTMADVTTNVFKRLTRFGIYVVLIALIPFFLTGAQVFLLYIQNKKFDAQNELIIKQNEKIDVQNNLVVRQNEKISIQISLDEANRRSNLIHLMSNIFDEVGNELKINRNRELSDELIGRIAALSHAFKPYRYLEDGELNENELSPERGQLLIALAKSNLGKSTYQKIYEEVKFDYADLSWANLNNANLEGAKLNEIILEGASLKNANLKNIVFKSSKLSSVNFSGVDLRGGNIKGRNVFSDRVDPEHSRKTESKSINIKTAPSEKIATVRVLQNPINFQEANLSEVDLSGLIFNDVRFDNAKMFKANLIGTSLKNAKLSNADLRSAYLRNTDLTRANLKGADLRGANLDTEKIIGINLKNSNLEDAIIPKNWFDLLEEKNVRDWQIITKNYIIMPINDKIRDHLDAGYRLKLKK